MENMQVHTSIARIQASQIIFFTLQKIPEFYHNGDLKGYSLTLIPLNNGGKTIDESAPGDVYSEDIRQIDCGTEYNVTIAARNMAGISPMESFMTIAAYGTGKYTF